MKAVDLHGIQNSLAQLDIVNGDDLTWDSKDSSFLHVFANDQQ